MSYANEILKDSPVAWWRLNERGGSTAADEIGSNDGTIPGSGVDLLANLLPNLGTGAEFDGTQSITLGTPSVLDFSTNNLFSVETWVRAPALQSRAGIIGSTTSTPQWGLMIDTSAGDQFFRWFMLPDSGVNALIVGSAPLDDNAVYQVVVTHSVDTTTVYVNGAQEAQDSQGTATRVLDSVSIGQYAETSLMIGAVDEVAIYHTVLSPTRVLAHYQAGLAMHLSASSALYDE